MSLPRVFGKPLPVGAQCPPTCLRYREELSGTYMVSLVPGTESRDKSTWADQARHNHAHHCLRIRPEYSEPDDIPYQVHLTSVLAAVLGLHPELSELFCIPRSPPPVPPNTLTRRLPPYIQATGGRACAFPCIRLRNVMATCWLTGLKFGSQEICRVQRPTHHITSIVTVRLAWRPSLTCHALPQAVRHVLARTSPDSILHEQDVGHDEFHLMIDRTEIAQREILPDNVTTRPT